MKIKSISILFFLLFVWTLQAATVQTMQIPSASMSKNVEVVVIAPESNKGPCPVIYLLHGYSGNAQTWIGIKPNLPEISEQYGVIFVCPDGRNSWYWDSPKNPSYRYETFVSKELVKYIDKNYLTVQDRSKRAITGLSMGGHGAFWIAVRNKSVFGTAGSMSGGVDIRPFPKNWEMSVQLGEMEANKEIWNTHTVINEVNGLKNGELKLIFDCGYDDFFFDVNNALHDKLIHMKIDHDYLVRPGGHDNTYWNNSIDYHILFFLKQFGIVK